LIYSIIYFFTTVPGTMVPGTYPKKYYKESGREEQLHFGIKYRCR